MLDDADSPGIPVSEWLYAHTSLVWATQREVEPDYLNFAYSVGNQVVAWLVRRGQVTVKAAGQTAIAREGQWIFPGTRDGWQAMRPGTVLLSIRFAAEWPTGKTLFDHHDMIVFSAQAEPKLTRAAAALENRVRSVSRRTGFFLLHQGIATVESYFAIRRVFEGWLSAYVSTMLRTGRQPTFMAVTDRRVLQAARLIDNRSPRDPLPENELARKVGLSVSQLNRLFSRELGTSPKRYLERRRLQEAILLLQHQRRPVKETAFELGFSSLPHFSAWFSRLQGVGPRAFQQSRT
jgi:AraC-like DNA-binding protein